MVRRWGCVPACNSEGRARSGVGAGSSKGSVANGGARCDGRRELQDGDVVVRGVVVVVGVKTDGGNGCGSSTRATVLSWRVSFWLGGLASTALTRDPARMLSPLEERP
jgi:hypothetical protein